MPSSVPICSQYRDTPSIRLEKTTRASKADLAAPDWWWLHSLHPPRMGPCSRTWTFPTNEIGATGLHCSSILMMMMMMRMSMYTIHTCIYLTWRSDLQAILATVASSLSVGHNVLTLEANFSGTDTAASKPSFSFSSRLYTQIITHKHNFAMTSGVCTFLFS